MVRATPVCAWRGTPHPDVHHLAPESATGYLIAQIRDLLDDVALAPIRAQRKVYIIERAEQLRANSDSRALRGGRPPAGVTFILLGHRARHHPPHDCFRAASACRFVPSRPLWRRTDVERATGLPLARCRMAVAVAGSPARAEAFLKSADRQEARRVMLRALDALPRADEADILAAANELLAAVRGPARRG